MTPTNKLIVRFKDGEAPVNAMPLAILENQPRIERLYKIDDEVQSFKSKNMESASLHATDEEIFQTEVYPQKTEEEKKLFNTFSVECDSTEQAAEVHDSLKKDDNVEFVQFDELNVLYLHPNDPLISNVWSLTKISCEPAWDISQGDDIVVAVIDTGVDYNQRTCGTMVTGSMVLTFLKTRMILWIVLAMEHIVREPLPQYLIIV